MTQDAAGATPASFSRRSAMIGLGFALTAGAAAAVTPRRHEATLGSAKLGAVIPQVVGPWRAQSGGSVILPEADDVTNVYDQVLTRIFWSEGLPTVMLLIAYGAAQSGLMKVHRPEVCYASAGFKITRFTPAEVPLAAGRSIAARSFLATRDTRLEQVLYWTRISNAFPRDLTAQRIVMLERGMMGVIPDGVLVRLSTVGPDVGGGDRAIQQFARTLVADAEPAGKALLIGRATPKIV